MSPHVPAPDRSIRPPDLHPVQREALRAKAARRTARRRRMESALLVVFALVVAFVLKTFVLQAFYIPSGSMIPTLQVGDRVLVEKLSLHAREPARGDVMVFQRPGAKHPKGVARSVRSFLEGLGVVQPDGNIDLIKRVVGLPGETVEVRDGTLHIDGRRIDEPYALLDDRDFEPVVVPDGHLFMMGDNRGNSDDSRYSLGTVPIDNLVGRAFVIVWPPGRTTLLLIW